MKTELINFLTKDKLKLPGILYAPNRKTKKVCLFLHGNGSSSIFYQKVLHDAIAGEFEKNNIAYFPFNNRGAHFIKSFSDYSSGEKIRTNLGMAFELIKDCVMDIDGAVAYLKKLGFTEFYLMGHSTGANKICVYNYYKPKNIFSKFILLGPGDDTGSYYEMFGKEKFADTLELCQKMMKEGRGEELVSRDVVPGNYISYQSLFDTINPEGDYNVFPYFEELHHLALTTKEKIWREYKSLKTKTLVVMGEHDEYCYDKVPEVMSILEVKAPDQRLFTFKTIKNTDHGFYKKEKELGKIVSDFCVLR